MKKNLDQEIFNFLQAKGVRDHDLKISTNLLSYFPIKPQAIIFCRRGKRLLIIVIYQKNISILIQETYDEIAPYWRKNQITKNLITSELEKLLNNPTPKFLAEHHYQYFNKSCLDFGEKNATFLEMIKMIFPEYHIVPNSLGCFYLHDIGQISHYFADLPAYLISRFYYLYGEKLSYHKEGMNMLKIILDPKKTEGVSGSILIKTKKDEIGEKIFYFTICSSQEKNDFKNPTIMMKIWQKLSIDSETKKKKYKKYFLITEKNSFTTFLGDDNDSILKNYSCLTFKKLFLNEILAIKEYFV